MVVDVSFLKASKGKVAPKIDVRKLDKHQVSKTMFMRDEYFRMVPDALIVRRVHKTPKRDYDHNGRLIQENTNVTTKLTIVGVPTYEVDRLNKALADGTLTNDEVVQEYEGKDLELSVVWSNDETQCMELLDLYSDTISAINHGTPKVLKGGKIGVRPKWQSNRSGNGGAFSGLELAYEEPEKVKVEDLG